jgi:hypothetical protein
MVVAGLGNHEFRSNGVFGFNIRGDCLNSARKSQFLVRLLISGDRILIAF